MTITGIISAIVIGLIIGALGRLVLPGPSRVGPAGVLRSAASSSALAVPGMVAAPPCPP